LKNNYNTRFFNEIKEENGKIIKKCILEEFKNLIECETNWYKYLTNKKYQNIPKIFSYNPLTMEKINGWHPYEYEKYKPDLSKKELIEKIIYALKDLHSIEKIKYNKEEAFNVYIKKTLERIHRVKPIIPYNEAEYFYVNGKKVINLFHPSTRGYLEKLFNQIYFPPYYTIIHGDPTFSNILIENKTNRILFIDPRGYFATTKIYGDPYYDFAKLYYSAIGNYDMFNQRNFILDINGIEVNIKIESNGFEETEKVFLKHFTNKEMKNIRILHTLIWLSLSGYVLDDVDSMIGAYFKGLELLKEVEELD
jgi:aminoglycoside phosphotransferase